MRLVAPEAVKNVAKYYKESNSYLTCLRNKRTFDFKRYPTVYNRVLHRRQYTRS